MDLSNESWGLWVMPCYLVIYTNVLTCRKEHIFYLKIWQVELSLSHPRSVSNGNLSQETMPCDMEYIK